MLFLSMYVSVGDLCNYKYGRTKLKIGTRGLGLVVGFSIIASSDKNKIGFWIPENDIFGSL